MFKKNREKQGYTQEFTAEILGISARHYQRIEKGENEPSLKLLKKIIKILKIPDNEIIKYMKK